MSSVFEIRDRAAELFRIHGTVPPQPTFGAEDSRYERTVLSAAQSLLPPGHVWGGVPLYEQPDSALPAITRALIDEPVRHFKRAEGPLRELSEVCPRTGRVTTKFYGSTEECWAPFKAVTRRVTHINGELGTGKNSVAAQAAAERGRFEQGQAFAALARERAAAGMR